MIDGRVQLQRWPSGGLNGLSLHISGVGAQRGAASAGRTRPAWDGAERYTQTHPLFPLFPCTHCWLAKNAFREVEASILHSDDSSVLTGLSGYPWPAATPAEVQFL